MKYIYDHGVEISPISESNEGGIITKGDTEIIIKGTASSQTNGVYSSEDLTTKSLIRFIYGDIYISDVYNGMGAFTDITGSNSLAISRSDGQQKPYFDFVDVSSVNQVAYVRFWSSNTGATSINEWWLE